MSAKTLDMGRLWPGSGSGSSARVRKRTARIVAKCEGSGAFEGLIIDLNDKLSAKPAWRPILSLRRAGRGPPLSLGGRARNS